MSALLGVSLPVIVTVEEKVPVYPEILYVPAPPVPDTNAVTVTGLVLDPVPVRTCPTEIEPAVGAPAVKIVSLPTVAIPVPENVVEHAPEKQAPGQTLGSFCSMYPSLREESRVTPFSVAPL
jgi:hypothetical protein